MRAWLAGLSSAVRGSLVLAAVVAAFVVGIAVQRLAGGGSEADFAGCGAGAPEWAQQSAEACAAFEEQLGDEGDTFDQRQADTQEQLRRFMEQDQARRDEYKDNLNCQVGPMFCPR